MDPFEAANRGDLQKLRVVLTVDNVNNVDSSGWTALHYAAHSDEFDCTKLCLAMGANVNACNKYGSTPLHHASAHSVDVVRLLLDAHATVDATDISGHTALYLVIFGMSGDYINIARLLIDRGARLSNVILDNYLRAIPDWVPAFIASRSNCRTVAITIIGIHKYHRTNITGHNDINILKLISKQIWSMRMDDAWK
jgi:ankyrin repeat protein